MKRRILVITAPMLLVIGNALPALAQESQPTARAPASKASDRPQIVFFYLHYADAGTMPDLVRQLCGSDGFTIVADKRTNSLIVRGSSEKLREIEGILLPLDQSRADETATSRAGVRDYLQPSRDYRITKGFDSTGRAGVDSLRDEYNRLDQQAAETAKKARELETKESGDKSGKGSAATVKAQLRNEVAAAFAARQRVQRAELAQLRQRLARVEEQIAARDRIKETIIDRRVEELLNPNLRWEPELPAKAASQEPSTGTPYGASGPPRTPARASGSTGAAAAPANFSKPGTPLLDAVREFNRKYADHPIGKGQPPLTDDEVVAVVRWAANHREEVQISDPEFAAFRSIAEERVLPDGWRFEALTDWTFNERGRFQGWSVRLVLLRPDGTGYGHVVRLQLIRQLRDGKPIEPTPSGLGTYEQDSTPLEAAIHGFNERHRNDPVGKDQPPLTEDEVIAAIHWCQRNEVDVTDAEFAAFQEIADRRRLPKGVEFEVLTRFQPGDSFEYDRWSVRIRMPRTAGPGWSHAYSIRERFVRSRRIDNGEIAWGPAAVNGMQAGVLFEPQNQHYTVGQRIVPRFFYRNVGQQQHTVSFPRLMTHSYYDAPHVADETGKAIAVDQNPEPAGPVGWIELPLAPNSQHEIKGLPIVVGDLPRDASVETVIRARPGQSCRIRFSVPNYADPKSPALQTGEIRFAIAVLYGDKGEATKADAAKEAKSQSGVEPRHSKVAAPPRYQQQTVFGGADVKFRN